MYVLLPPSQKADSNAAQMFGRRRARRWPLQTTLTADWVIVPQKIGRQVRCSWLVVVVFADQLTHRLLLRGTAIERSAARRWRKRRRTSGIRWRRRWRGGGRTVERNGRLQFGFGRCKVRRRRCGGIQCVPTARSIVEWLGGFFGVQLMVDYCGRIGFAGAAADGWLRLGRVSDAILRSLLSTDA